MKEILVHIMCIYTMLLVLSCNISAKLWNGGDTAPPILKQFTVANTQELQFNFNESINTQSVFFKISKKNLVSKIEIQDKLLSILLSSIIPGEKYHFETKVFDYAGNSTLIIDSFYGYNDRVPHMLISEFICEGSKKNGDKVELAVLSDGNTAGMVLQEGIGNEYTIRAVLPALEVKQGDYVIIHFRPYPAQNIQNETNNKKESTHKQAYTSAWDIFLTKDKGISNTNSVLVLLTHTKGKIIDAVIYSIKEDNIQDKYKGFGNKAVYKWAQQLFILGAWKSQSDKTTLMPSDTVNPQDSTTTRSITRNAIPKDTNTKEDWHITPTRGSTFGKENNNTIYKK